MGGLARDHRRRRSVARHTLTGAQLAEEGALADGDECFDFTFGSLLLRTTYHYWFHTGENMATRQLLGHRDLTQFVGDIDEEAPYQSA